jgi:3-hydroxyacyl-CoA dehydrogenase
MPPQMLIVELMTDGHTYPEIFPFLTTQLKVAGLHPIVALKESTGFVFNRIWAAIKRETIKVLAEGVSIPSEIDRVFKENYGVRAIPNPYR